MIQQKFNTFFRKVCDTVKNTDKKILHTVQKGILFSSIFCLLGIILLVIHNLFFITCDLIDDAIILFQTSIIFAMQFILCGFAFDKISKS